MNTAAIWVAVILSAAIAVLIGTREMLLPVAALALTAISATIVINMRE